MPSTLLLVWDSFSLAMYGCCDCGVFRVNVPVFGEQRSERVTLVTDEDL